MNTTLRSLTLLLRERKGQSLAEFAVITAMMATFVTTSIPGILVAILKIQSKFLEF